MTSRTGRLLLDTHVLVWAVSEPKRLRPAIRRRLLEADASLVLSRASVWELAIKRSLGKIRLPLDLRDFIEQATRDLSLDYLPIENRHLFLVAELPFHHRDPFDRLLAAQALEEGLTLLSHDEVFDAYGVDRIR